MEPAGLQHRMAAQRLYDAGSQASIALGDDADGGLGSGLAPDGLQLRTRDRRGDSSGPLNPPHSLFKLCPPCPQILFPPLPTTTLSIPSRLPSSFAFARLSCFLGASLSRIAACFAFGTSADEFAHGFCALPATLSHLLFTVHSPSYRARSPSTRRRLLVRALHEPEGRSEPARALRRVPREPSAKFSVHCATARRALAAAVTSVERVCER